MPTFERSALVRADAAALFDLMQDYDRRLRWDPFLREARLVDATAAGLGVRAWCVDQRGRGMETEYVSFDRPRRVAVKMMRTICACRAICPADAPRAARALPRMR